MTTELLAGIPHSLLLSNSNGEMAVLVPVGAARPAAHRGGALLDRARARPLRPPMALGARKPFLHLPRARVAYLLVLDHARLRPLPAAAALPRPAVRPVAQLVDTVASDTDLTPEEANSLQFMTNAKRSEPTATPTRTRAGSRSRRSCSTRRSHCRGTSPPRCRPTSTSCSTSRPTAASRSRRSSRCSPTACATPPTAASTTRCTRTTRCSCARTGAPRCARTRAHREPSAPSSCAAPRGVASRGSTVAPNVLHARRPRSSSSCWARWRKSTRTRARCSSTACSPLRRRSTPRARCPRASRSPRAASSCSTTCCRAPRSAASHASDNSLAVVRDAAAPLLRLSSRSSSLLGSLLLTLARKPLLGPFLPEFVDTRKYKRRDVFTGLPLPDEAEAPLGKLLTSCCGELHDLGGPPRCTRR